LKHKPQRDKLAVNIKNKGHSLLRASTRAHTLTMSGTTTATYEKWIDRQVVDNDGHRIGIVVDIYLDDASGYPEWLAVMTGLFGSRLSFVPISGAVEAGGKVCITFPKGFVKDSPNIDSDGTLSVEDEHRLYRHYGIKYSELAPATPEPATATTPSNSDEKKPPRRRLRKRSEKSIDLRGEE
jgi:hypothetical protein